MVATVNRRSLISCTILAACGAAAPASEVHESPAGGAAVPPAEVAPQIEVALVADVSRVAPGQEFLVGATLEVEPGWHIYWINPGEAGLPTRMVLSAPEGFEVGPSQYPGPVRFDSPGPVTSYGYQGSTMLSARVLAPDTVDAAVEVTAELSWLACKEACVQGSAQPRLVLAPATAAEPSQPANAARFDAHRADLPVPWSELDGATSTWQTRGSQQELVLTMPGEVSLEFFPGPDTELAMVGQASAPLENETALRLLLRPGDTPERLTGVVRIGAEADRPPRYGEIDLSWPLSGEVAADAAPSPGDSP